MAHSYLIFRGHYELFNGTQLSLMMGALLRQYEQSDAPPVDLKALMTWWRDDPGSRGSLGTLMPNLDEHLHEDEAVEALRLLLDGVETTIRAWGDEVPAARLEAMDLPGFGGFVYGIEAVRLLESVARFRRVLGAE